ncbi:MAG: multicopper oxidase domain-containing protein [Chloroflexota bacterium]
MPSRREFLKIGGASAAFYALARNRLLRKAFAAPLAMGLSDPALQPKFVEYVPNALDPGFIFEPQQNGPQAGQFNVYIRQSVQQTGLINTKSGKKLDTTIWGYGYDDARGVTWPGRTFQVQSGIPTTVRWNNDLRQGNKPLEHLLPVDTSLHWAYSLPGYEQYSIKNNGVPIVTHLHGGHTDFQFDGNPEFFWSPDYAIEGPQWAPLGGIIKDFVYDNDQSAGNLWYHDHALGITRLNVYAGLAGFYFVRDVTGDSGLPGNSYGLPAFPYELAYAIQDRMFTDKGELFYPAFPGDPFYDDFITGEGAILPPDIFRGGGPTALAEFFGDHMVVNGKIWPKANVEPRNYRMRLLNGTDSRFMVLRFSRVPAGASTLDNAGAPLPFYVIGSDQGLGTPAQVDTLVFEPGGRYDIVFDFSEFGPEDRIIMENIGGDAPFGGAFGDALEPEDFFPERQTDRIMAFDVVLPLDTTVLDTFDPTALPGYGGVPDPEDTVRRVALFEGMDEFGRLQPLLGTAEPTVDAAGNTVSGAIAWHSPTTENPVLDETEIWEIYNATGDAHPVHLHLVNFQVLDRREFTAEVIEQSILQHNGTTGTGFRLENIAVGDLAPAGPAYVESAPKDMVTALPGQVTRIKATFDKPGRYVWHCHILSHEDHEMMRVLQVVSDA